MAEKSESDPAKEEIRKFLLSEAEKLSLVAREVSESSAAMNSKLSVLEDILKSQRTIATRFEDGLDRLHTTTGKISDAAKQSITNIPIFETPKAISPPLSFSIETSDPFGCKSENVVLDGEKHLTTPYHIVLKTVSSPSFEFVLERPFHGFAENLINTTRGFIPIAAMIFKYQLEERCKEEKKPLVVDVGANIGYLTGFSQALGCKVFSFEPFPSAFRVMRSTVKRNPHSQNVFTYPQVVSAERGFLSIQENPKWTFNRVKSDGNLRIATIPLDEVVTEAVTMLKIDVEGHEMQVLQGAKRLLSSGNVENIVIEMKKEGDVKERRAWINSMVANTKYKVYAFNEGYREVDIDRMYRNFDLLEHTSRFVRIESPIGEEDWIPFEDLYLTRNSPFSF